LIIEPIDKVFKSDLHFFLIEFRELRRHTVEQSIAEKVFQVLHINNGFSSELSFPIAGGVWNVEELWRLELGLSLRSIDSFPIHPDWGLLRLFSS
jgi:hypothetical protein